MGPTFFDLPPEIRNTIYNLILHIDGPASKRPALKPEHLNEPTVAAVSHQVREEILSIHYASYIFQAELLHQSVTFVELLEPARAAMLTEIRVCQWDDGLPERIKEMLDCVRKDRDCRLKGVRKEAVFVPVAPGSYERLMDSAQSMLWRKIGVILLAGHGV